VDDVPLWEWASIAVCLVLSAFFSATETALTATPHYHIKKLVRDGLDPTRILALWTAHPNRVLTSILVGNNLVNIFAAALATDIALGIFAHSGVAVATGAMTLLTLVVGEVLPKTLAKQHAERVSPWLARVLLLPYWLFYPLTWCLVKFVRGLVRLSGGDLTRRGPFVTEKGIRELIEMSEEEEGGLEKEKRDMLGRVIKMGDTVVREVMVPRTDIVAIPAGSAFDDVLQGAISSGHSRLPVYQDNLDNIKGFVCVKDLLKHVALGSPEFRLEAYLRQPHYVPETKPIADLLEEFQRDSRHAAIVVDEYGGTAGLVTLEDVLEEIVGEIEDEYDASHEKREIVAVGPATYMVQARVDLDKLEEELDLTFSRQEEEEGEEYDSLGGFISAVLGHVPRKGETLSVDGALLSIEEATPQRVLRVRIEKRPPAPGA
jgi:CBS domain containing-hemolysin-like protein